MECKCHQRPRVFIPHRELIDNIMECKFRLFNRCLVRLWLELIDTLWNVNYFVKIFLFLNLFELIDTLWNVNEILVGAMPTIITN